jgi:D-alanyl-D-alanine carboxypeptidase
MTTAQRSTCRDFPGTVFRLGARLFLLLALAGAGMGAASVHTATPSLGCAERLKPLVTAKMSELGVPGLIVSIDAPNLCRWTEALGIRDATKHRPMQGNEHMRIGSITKTFTGTVVLQLVDEGWLGLDDPISRYLTGVPNGDHITIRQLLTMTSGLYNYSDDLAFNASLDTDPQRVWTPEELLAIGLAQPPYFLPGTAFHYSNTNSVLLGRLIEALTGHPLEQAFAHRIFTPLKLHDTSLPATAAIPRPHPRGYMFGTNVGTVPPACDAATVGRHDVTEASPSWTWSAGGAVSTLQDLTVWARALATGALLSPATQAERLQGVPVGPPPAPEYGLHITNFFGLIGHDGNLPGFSSFIAHDPARDVTLVVLANVYTDAHCGGPADSIVMLIIQELGLLGP